MTRFTTVLIGFGKVADTLRHDSRMAHFFPDASHAQVLARHPRFDFAAVVDPSAEARARAQYDWRIDTVVGDLADLPDRERYTAAVIASPPAGRSAVIDALPNLRAVLVEKPLGKNPQEARAFVEVCQKRGIAVQVNYWRRAVPVFRALAQGGLKESVGDVQAVFGLYGNGLMNNGSHLVDFLRMLCGEVETIATGPAAAAQGSSVPGDVNVACLLRLTNGASVALSPVDFSAWREVSLDIWGREGRLAVMQESLAVTHYPLAENRGLENEWEIDSGAGRIAPVDTTMCLQTMYDNLAGALDGDPLLSSVDEALKTEVTMHAMLNHVSRPD